MTVITNAAKTVPPIATGLLTMLATAGLTGRGGGSFPTATKIESAMGRSPRLIINATESEPDSAKDAWIIRTDPEPMLAGAAAVASTVAASGVWVAVHRGSAVHRGWHADPRLSSSGHRLLIMPTRYVAGEASSLVSRMDGGLARPLDKPVPLTRGAGGHHPSALVLNAETLYWIGQIGLHGVDWFSAWGTSQQPGPRLVTVAAGGRRRVLTSAAGTPIGEIIRQAGFSLPESGAVQLGGYGGGWMKAAQARHLPWSDDALSPHGLGIGSGIIRVTDAHECPLSLVARQLSFLAAESAGQCGPCMFGLPAVADDWRQLITGSAPARQRLRRRLGLLPGRGACHHPDGAARNARTALAAFGDEVDRHLAGCCGYDDPERVSA